MGMKPRREPLYLQRTEEAVGYIPRNERSLKKIITMTCADNPFRFPSNALIDEIELSDYKNPRKVKIVVTVTVEELEN